MEKVSRGLNKMKELATEKFEYLRNVVKNNKRQTVYAVAVTSSAATPYLITRDPAAAVVVAVASFTLCIVVKAGRLIDRDRKLSQYPCRN